MLHGCPIYQLLFWSSALSTHWMCVDVPRKRKRKIHILRFLLLAGGHVRLSLSHTLICCYGNIVICSSSCPDKSVSLPDLHFPLGVLHNFCHWLSFQQHSAAQEKRERTVRTRFQGSALEISCHCRSMLHCCMPGSSLSWQTSIQPQATTHPPMRPTIISPTYSSCPVMQKPFKQPSQKLPCCSPCG